MNSFKESSRIAIFGVPRSGTSWLGQIFNSSPQVAYRYQPLFSYEFKDQLNQGSTKGDIKRFHNDLTSASSDFVLQSVTISGDKGPVFSKKNVDTLVWKEVRYLNIIENLLTEDGEIKIVGIIRNPKSVINSWYSAPKEFNKEKMNILKEWRYANKKNEGRAEEFNGYEKWKEAALLFSKLQIRYPDRFYMIHYTDLLLDTATEVGRLFNFCNIRYTKQTANFIVASQDTDGSKDAYSVYRKNQTDDKWKKNLPKEICVEIDKDLRDTQLMRFNR